MCFRRLTTVLTVWRYVLLTVTQHTDQCETKRNNLKHGCHNSKFDAHETWEAAQNLFVTGVFIRSLHSARNEIVVNILDGWWIEWMDRQRTNQKLQGQNHEGEPKVQVHHPFIRWIGDGCEQGQNRTCSRPWFRFKITCMNGASSENELARWTNNPRNIQSR